MSALRDQIAVIVGRSSGMGRAAAVSYAAPGAKVVDLGCGGGVPLAKYFAERGYAVEGYDLSAEMVAIARGGRRTTALTSSTSNRYQGPS